MAKKLKTLRYALPLAMLASVSGIAVTANAATKVKTTTATTSTKTATTTTAAQDYDHDYDYDYGAQDNHDDGCAPDGRRDCSAHFDNGASCEAGSPAVGQRFSPVGQCFSPVGQCFAALGQRFPALRQRVPSMGQCFAPLGQCVAAERRIGHNQPVSGVIPDPEWRYAFLGIH